MNNKKAKQMVESITGAKYAHLRHNGEIEGKYCLRLAGMPVNEIKKIDWDSWPYYGLHPNFK